MKFLRNTDPRFHLVETRARFFIFLAVAGFLSLVGFVIWKQEIFRSARHIHLIAASSEGIQKGMAARLSGFRIGKVGNVELEGENRVRVTLEVFNEYAHFLRQDSAATIASESLIGDRFIDLKAGTSATPELKEGDTLPLAPEKSISTLMESLKDEIRPAVIETREIISYLNDPKGDFKTMLSGLRVTADALKGEMPQIMKDIQSVTQEGTDLFTRLNKPDAELWKALGHLEQLTHSLNRDFPPIVTRFGDGVTTLQGAVGKLDRAISESGPEIPRLIRKGTDTLRSADEVLNSIKGLWPVSQGVPKKKENLLRLPNEP